MEYEKLSEEMEYEKLLENLVFLDVVFDEDKFLKLKPKVFNKNDWSKITKKIVEKMTNGEETFSKSDKWTDKKWKSFVEVFNQASLTYENINEDREIQTSRSQNIDSSEIGWHKGENKKVLFVIADRERTSDVYAAQYRLGQIFNEKDDKIKVETHTSIGIRNEITATDVADADLVIIATNGFVSNLKLERFIDKFLYEVSIDKLINNCSGIISTAVKKSKIYQPKLTN